MGEMTMPDRQPTLEDNSGGAVAEAIADGVGVYTIPLFIDLASIDANEDCLSGYTPGHRFEIVETSFGVEQAVTTAARRADFNIEIGATNVAGGVVSVTSALATPDGALIAGSPVTGDNVGSATDTISVESSNVTAHAEGSGWLFVKIKNLDTADAFASIREWMKDNAKIKA